MRCIGEILKDRAEDRMSGSVERSGIDLADTARVLQVQCTCVGRTFEESMINGFTPDQQLFVS